MLTHANGFRAIKTLRKAARDPRIAEIEGHGCDEGRVFLHTRRGWWFRGYRSTSMTVGSVKELRRALELLEPKPREAT